MKIPKRLQPLVEMGLVQRVVRPLTSGKEAALFEVMVGDARRVAKVYKGREERTFKRRDIYEEGRKVRGSREERALRKGSRFGRECGEDAWQSAEMANLWRLLDGGVPVPKPYAFVEGVLLMELIVDATGEVAPRLWDYPWTAVEARTVFLSLVQATARALRVGLIHGDLSEYNVLMGAEGPVIIDVPQAIEAANHPQARRLLLRDVANLRAFFARFAPELAMSRFGEEMWRCYERGELGPDTTFSGKWRDSEKRVDVKQLIESCREEEAFARRGPAVIRRGLSRAELN